MSISVWKPLSEIEDILDSYHKMAKRDDPVYATSDWTPAVDIDENDNEFSIKAELPGVKKADVKVNIVNDVLTIKGEKKTEVKDKKQHRVERSYGSFVRSFTLPHAVDSSKVGAEYAQGVLNLVIPKSEAQKPKQIDIKVK